MWPLWPSVSCLKKWTNKTAVSAGMHTENLLQKCGPQYRFRKYWCLFQHKCLCLLQRISWSYRQNKDTETCRNVMSPSFFIFLPDRVSFSIERSELCRQYQRREDLALNQWSDPLNEFSAPIQTKHRDPILIVCYLPLHTRSYQGSLRKTPQEERWSFYRKRRKKNESPYLDFPSHISTESKASK